MLYHTWCRPEAWQHDDVRVHFKHIDMFAGIAQAQPKKAYGQFFLLNMTMTTRIENND